MDALMKSRRRLASLPYAHCTTRIVNLHDLVIPDVASDSEYRAIYSSYVQNAHANPNAAFLRDAVESIQHGISPPVAFPTETVYGLGTDATNEPAVSGIFAAKGRPSDNPLIVHVSSVAQLEHLTGKPVPEIYRALCHRFWPGPLTILLPVPNVSKFARNVHPGQPTIGFRIPASKYARFFIAATGRPIAGPSANSSGKPSPTTPHHVMDDLQGKINFILDGGSCDVGVESTVIDGLHDPPLILRPGGVSQAELIAHGLKEGNRFAHTAIGYRRQDGEASVPSPMSTSSTSTDSLLASTDDTAGPRYYEDANGAPRAPGMKYRHYAPKGKLVLFSERAVSSGLVAEKLHVLLNSTHRSVNIGIISCHWPRFAALAVSLDIPMASPPAVLTQSPYGSRAAVATMPGRDATLYNIQIGPEITELAHSLFGVLRLFDDLECDFIFAEAVKRTPTDGVLRSHDKSQDVEDAVIDRMDKAAGEKVD